jgi:hypothetical protein
VPFEKLLLNRKVNILSLIFNPLWFFIVSWFKGRKSFVENSFQNVLSGNISKKQKSKFQKTVETTLKASGITEMPGRPGAGKKALSEKEKVSKFVLTEIFPDPNPSTKIINEIDFKKRLEKAARRLIENEDYQQYNNKNVQAVMAEIEQFIQEDLVEDSYDGPLPSGLDFRGRRFTKKTYSPREIVEQPLVYSTIRDEIDHESNSYGSKELVEYYKNKSKFFSNENMEKKKYENEMKKKAREKEEKPSRSEQASKPVGEQKSAPAKTENRNPIDKKVSKKSFFDLFKKAESIPKIAQDAKTQAILQKMGNVSNRMNKESRERYIENKTYSSGQFFPVNGNDLEKYLGLSNGTLSIFMKKNQSEFMNNFSGVKVRNQIYYFPRVFLNSNKIAVIKYYEGLIDYEEKSSLPNQENISLAYDMVSAIKSMK